MTRPRIGITTSYAEGRQSLDISYIRAIEASGGLPLIVPMLQDADAAAAFAELLDGLVITGGPGITQGLIGKLPDDLPPVAQERDSSDRLIFDAMAQKPVLGICYGMQFINALAGGSIYADVSAQREGSLNHSQGRGEASHAVRIAPDSHLARAIGTDNLSVNSYHIQAVADLGMGLRAVGHGPDGVIEAIESTDGRMIGVQFHPERMLDHTQPLFGDFVARCAARA